jgi:hypothetical protein
MILRLYDLSLNRERDKSNEMSLRRIRSILHAQTYLNFDNLKCHVQISTCQLLPPRKWCFLVCTICHWRENGTKTLKCRSVEFKAYSTLKLTICFPLWNGKLNLILLKLYLLEILNSCLHMSVCIYIRIRIGWDIAGMIRRDWVSYSIESWRMHMLSKKQQKAGSFTTPPQTLSTPVYETTP